MEQLFEVANEHGKQCLLDGLLESGCFPELYRELKQEFDGTFHHYSLEDYTDMIE